MDSSVEGGRRRIPFYPHNANLILIVDPDGVERLLPFRCPLENIRLIFGLWLQVVVGLSYLLEHQWPKCLDCPIFRAAVPSGARVVDVYSKDLILAAGIYGDEINLN